MKHRPRSRDIPRLTDVGEFGLMTVDTMHARHFADQRVAAAESFLRRQCRAGWLDVSPLYRQKVYYRLTRRSVEYLRGTEHLPLSRAVLRPLKPLTKVQRYAALLYCTPAHGTLRRLCRPSHDPERFPDLTEYIRGGAADPLRQKLFYRDGDLTGLLLVDRGQHLFLERKVKPKVLSLARWQSFLDLLQTGRFRLTIVSPSSTRAAELEADIRADAPEFPWEIVPLPELAQLLPRRRLLAPLTTTQPPQE